MLLFLVGPPVNRCEGSGEGGVCKVIGKGSTVDCRKISVDSFLDISSSMIRRGKAKGRVTSFKSKWPNRWGLYTPMMRNRMPIGIEWRTGLDNPHAFKGPYNR
jgi:hypothetical protein